MTVAITFTDNSSNTIFNIWHTYVKDGVYTLVSKGGKNNMLVPLCNVFAITEVEEEGT